jgi:carotenoid cleavage dioxygenase
LEPDLSTSDLKVGGNIKGLFLHESGQWGSEAVFVPRTVDKNILEDDGYLICCVYNEKMGSNSFFDTKIFSPTYLMFNNLLHLN